MSNRLEYIIRDVLSEISSEQPKLREASAVAAAFDAQQQRFLGSFAAAGSQHLGIIYSISDIGIREFVARSGAQYGCTPAVLLSLLRGKYIKIVQYTGYGQNNDYTIELQLPLDSIQQYASLVGKKDGEGDAPPAGGDTSSPSGGGGGSFGGGGGGGLPAMDSADSPDLDLGDAEGAPDLETPADAVEDEPEAEPLEVAHVVKYGDLLRESTSIAKQLILEAKKSKKKVRR